MNKEIEYFQFKIKHLENEIETLTNIKNQIQKEVEEKKTNEIRCFKFSAQKRSILKENNDNTNTINAFTINESD